MTCSRARSHLMAGAADATDRQHMRDCAVCARFAERFERSSRALAAHRADVRPDPAFAARVVASLPRPTPLLGWAASRLLPAAAALALVLSAWVWLRTPSPDELVAAGPTDDLVSWVLTNGEGSQ